MQACSILPSCLVFSLLFYSLAAAAAAATTALLVLVLLNPGVGQSQPKD